MTRSKMYAIWLWMLKQLRPPYNGTRAPGMRVGVVPGGWDGICYESGWIIVPPWSVKWKVVHEFCHHLFWQADVEHTPMGGRFLQTVGRFSWDDRAKEQFASTLCGILTGVWRGNPVRKAAWTLEPLLTEQAWQTHPAREASR